MLKKLIYSIIFLCLAVVAVSCADDGLGIIGNGEEREFRGTIEFDLSTPGASDRTRALNTQAGANVLIGNLWIGVFDINTGDCIGIEKMDNFNTSMVSGTVMKNMIKVDYITRGATMPLAFIAAVANYDGVKTHEGSNLTDLLPDFDHRAEISWDKLISIGIDTESAYTGNKGEDDSANAPFMAGFYQEATILNRNPKIDQFAYDEEGPNAIYPTEIPSGMQIRLGDENSDKPFVAAGAICLRRLISHNVLRFNMTNGYQLTSVKYKRHNMPRAVFMLQRRTDTQKHNDFKTWQKYSPNLADHLLTEGNYNTDDPSFPYESDKEWNEVPLYSWDNHADIVIPFDHFENKHWGLGNLLSQEDREARNPDGTFAALCSGTSDAYNNFASYFTLALHIINKETGESADVEYTLHEGFCNNEDGNPAASPTERFHDFGSFRNTNYTYRINIAGISDITASVTSDSGQHPDGQTGSIWKMEFANGTGATAIPVAGGLYDFNGKYMTFGSNPDLGFRIYGPDLNKNIADICFNMPEGMYEGFYGLWPLGNPTYVDSPDAAAIPQNLLEGMKIVSSTGTTYTLTEFVKGVNGGSISPSGRYAMQFDTFDGKSLGLVENVKRGIFIFDRNDLRNASDGDGCSSYNLAYGGLQNSHNMETFRFNINDIVVWDNPYYKNISDGKATVYAFEAPIFYGAEASAIEMRWKHDPRIQGYEITVYNDSYRSPTVIVGPGQTQKYLKQVKGETVFVYPFSTAAFPRRTASGANNYSFRVVPIVDEESYRIEEGSVFDVIHRQTGNDETCVRVCYPQYDLNSSGSNDWKSLFPIAGKTIDAHYRGLCAYTNREIGDTYKATDNWCYGGAGSVTDRYFSFVASVPGKFEVRCKNNSSTGPTDATRQLVIARVHENGSQTNGGIRYDVVYESKEMPTSAKTFSAPISLVNDEPTEFRIYTAGSVNYYSIKFIPN